MTSDSLAKGRIGYITATKESRYGSLCQEIVAHIITGLFLASILLFYLVKPLKPFVVRQLKTIDRFGNKKIKKYT